MIDFVHGNCIAGMGELATASIPLIVTSPPYNAGKAYGTYSDDKTLEEYREFAAAWIAAAARVLDQRGSLWLNVGYLKLGSNQTLPLTYLYHPLAQAVGLKLVQEIVWRFEGGMSYKRRFSHRTERWMWFAHDPDAMTFNLDDVRDLRLNRTVDKRNHSMGKNPTDCWYFNRVVGGKGAGKDKKNHPCQFPVPMIERIIKACSNAGEMVLDPFGGSGSTAMAAKNTGRNCISIELDQSFHEAAQQRLAA